MNISEQVQTNWMKLIMADGFGLPLVAFGFQLANLFVQLCAFTQQVFYVVLSGLQIHQNGSSTSSLLGGVYVPFFSASINAVISPLFIDSSPCGYA